MNWATIAAASSGALTGILGLLGYALCYLPIVAGFAAGFTGMLGTAATLTHDNAHWLLAMSVVLMSVGALAVRKRRARPN